MRLPTARKRALITLVRNDIVAEWGFPSVEATPPLPRLHLADVLQPAAEVEHLFL